VCEERGGGAERDADPQMGQVAALFWSTVNVTEHHDERRSV